MSYGSPEWQGWVLGEKESMEQIKAAYDLGINAFDTANVYSNGLSETILGKAIKEYNLPRDEIVVMTKVYGCVGREMGGALFGTSAEELDKLRYTNQRGLSRKVRSTPFSCDGWLAHSASVGDLQHIFESIKHSLDRLQLDYVDLFQCESPLPSCRSYSC